MGLFTYMEDTQRLIHDAKQDIIDPQDIIRYVNLARRETAMRAQCVEQLTPISGSVVKATITARGSGYTNPTITITPPDFPGSGPLYPNGLQALATVSQLDGQINDVEITLGGYGYFMPQATISDPTGTGATVTLQVSGFNQLNQGQEVYPFSLVNLSNFPGVKSIYMVRSVSIIYANYRYSLPCYSFSTYQAMIRQYPFQYQYVSTFAAQLGRGTAAAFFFYPLPSQTYQMEWDCCCLPADLTTDQSVDAIPEPWTDSVPLYAAHKAFLEMQNFNSAKGMLALYDEYMHRYSSYTSPGRVTNPYGRY